MMKRITKWILGILCVLLILVLLGVAGFRKMTSGFRSESFAGNIDPALLESFDPNAKPEFVAQGCPVLMPLFGEVECGTVLVPEDWNNPDNGRVVQLAVAVYRAKTTSPLPDPILLLDGGPGSSTLRLMSKAYWVIAKPWLSDRDFVTYNQRGIDSLHLNLSCPKGIDAKIQHLVSNADSVDEAEDKYIKALADCANELRADGVNLSIIKSVTSKSVTSAADVEAIRIALGYDQWNLYGASYGTRLAQIVMRDYPKSVRSVILDGPLPVEAVLLSDYPVFTDATFTTIFERCQQNVDCNTNYPDLENRFYSLVDQLNSNPLEVALTIPGAQKKLEEINPTISINREAGR